MNPEYGWGEVIYKKNKLLVWRTFEMKIVTKPSYSVCFLFYLGKGDGLPVIRCPFTVKEVGRVAPLHSALPCHVYDPDLTMWKKALVLWVSVSLLGVCLCYLKKSSWSAEAPVMRGGKYGGVCMAHKRRIHP